MRRLKFSIVLLSILTLATLVYADSLIKKFTLIPGYNKVTLKWETGDETGVKGYEVQRGRSEENLTKIAFVDAKKTSIEKNEYEYEDKSVFKQGSSSRTYYYRLKIEREDGSHEYSEVEEANPTISSARQTWGSIKAMFR